MSIAMVFLRHGEPPFEDIDERPRAARCSDCLLKHNWTAAVELRGSAEDVANAKKRATQHFSARMLKRFSVVVPQGQGAVMVGISAISPVSTKFSVLPCLGHESLYFLFKLRRYEIG